MHDDNVNMTILHVQTLQGERPRRFQIGATTFFSQRKSTKRIIGTKNRTL